MPKHRSEHRGKILNSTQEVLYQKEFKRADRIYNQLSQKGNRG
ncbi:YfhE family protein [Oceanobacillus caeni]|nr:MULTISPECIES: YfhE family protein [Bacillaceae]PZD85004.1 YfhE family protein [Bacilli bacterium]MBU8791800.1 YfhE family protein [Oceanobacillus caeni]MCR1835963.1 YfhE family protein [Oceanobacillus caeni]MED4475624.1 YfhE family protein [Oceanobacillus caeni]PZD85859.1 YfhE family protein [Bacilli bacterium]